MKMNISSIETHEREHRYRYEQKDLEQLAVEKVAQELGLDLSDKTLKVKSRIISNSHGINPTTYECEVLITEVLDCKD